MTFNDQIRHPAAMVTSLTDGCSDGSGGGGVNDVSIMTRVGQLRLLYGEAGKLRSLRLDPAEYGCLKAIVLFNSGK